MIRKRFKRFSYTQGHKDGFKEGVASRQEFIDAFIRQVELWSNHGRMFGIHPSTASWNDLSHRDDFAKRYDASYEDGLRDGRDKQRMVTRERIGRALRVAERDIPDSAQLQDLGP